MNKKKNTIPKKTSPKHPKPKDNTAARERETLNALKGSGGIMSTVAKRLECDWHTAERYVNLWESTKQAFKDERETILDMAESTILTGIKDGDLGSARWMLATLGKNRGYTEKVEMEHSGSVVIIDDVK